VENYLYKKKFDILDMKIINCKIKSSILNKIVDILNILFNKNTFIISIFILFFIPKILIGVENTDINDININSIAIVYLLQFGIIFLHELGHYQEYVKKCKRDYGYFGIGLRYFFLILFYIDVSFLNTLSKNEKIKIILSGIRNQFILNGIFTIIYMITNSKIVLYTICINCIIITVNLLPFMKLDGFWLINTLLNTDNYMSDFFTGIRNRKKVNFSSAILSILNIIIIVTMLFITFFNLINKII